MYDDNINTLPNKEKAPKEHKEKRKSVFTNINFNWQSALKKIGILAVAVFAIIFISTKVGQHSETKYLEKNLDTMKTGAYKYFKEFDKPTEVEEEISVTLQDLIDSDMLDPIKDKSGNLCDTESSLVSIVKETNTKYNLVAHLNCNSKEQEKEYKLTYSSTSSSASKTEKTVYYKLQKEVNTNNYTYSCPDGYILNGSHCYSKATTFTTNAIARYKTINAKTTKPSYKKPTDEYEYVEPVETTNPATYTCSDKDAVLNGDKCIITKSATMKEDTSYSCKEGTLDGTKCVITKDAKETRYEYYCSSGKLVDNDKCELKKSYVAKYDCPSDYPNRDGNQCYYTEKAYRDYGDWHYKGTKTFSREKESTDTVRYDEIDSYESSNGKMKYVYKYYTKSKEYQCDDGGELKGSRCYYYTDAYKTKECSNGYDLNEDETKCIKIVDAKEKKTSKRYVCEDGYSKKGSGSETTCVKKVNAEKTITSKPTCSTGYNPQQNSDGTYYCTKTVDAKMNEEKSVYVCPTGYESKGSGSSMKCYKKTTQEGYYYCKNSEATLDGTECKTEAKTELIGYKCPSGYDLNGTSCIKVISGGKISATKTNNPDVELTYKWSTKKSESGWTFTGETKEV